MSMGELNSGRMALCVSHEVIELSSCLLTTQPRQRMYSRCHGNGLIMLSALCIIHVGRMIPGRQGALAVLHDTKFLHGLVPDSQRRTTIPATVNHCRAGIQMLTR